MGSEMCIRDSLKEVFCFKLHLLLERDRSKSQPLLAGDSFELLAEFELEICVFLNHSYFRFYSISSSSRVNPESIHITGVVVEYDTPTGRRNKGVATKWLEPMVPTSETEVYIES